MADKASSKKRCGKCRVQLPRGAFQKDAGAKDGLYGWCRECNNAKMREYYHAHKQERLAYVIAYREKHKESINAKTRQWGRENRGRVRQQKLLKAYGLTAVKYDELLTAQNNVCAICGGSPQAEHYGVLAVDHCHQDGHVRGLLCQKCNNGLGGFDDDPARLQRAITYLEQAHARQKLETV